jgi:hypothetical protein
MDYGCHYQSKACEKHEITIRQEGSESRSTSVRIRRNDFSGLTELNNGEITNLIIGKRLSNTPNQEYAYRLFVEEFEESGLWVNNILSRAQLQIVGSWWVKNNKVCVSTSNRPELCRSIYIDRETGEIWMSEYTAPRPIEVFRIFFIKRGA